MYLNIGNLNRNPKSGAGLDGGGGGGGGGGDKHEAQGAGFAVNMLSYKHAPDLTVRS